MYTPSSQWTPSNKLITALRPDHSVVCHLGPCHHGLSRARARAYNGMHHVHHTTHHLTQLHYEQEGSWSTPTASLWTHSEVRYPSIHCNSTPPHTSHGRHPLHWPRKEHITLLIVEHAHSSPPPTYYRVSQWIQSMLPRGLMAWRPLVFFEETTRLGRAYIF